MDITEVATSPLAQPSRFVRAGQHEESPELFLASVHNHYAGRGLVLEATRLLRPIGTERPTPVQMLRVVLDHSGWEDIDLRHTLPDGFPGASLGHELIRHGWQMVNRETLYVAPKPLDYPAGAREPGPRVFGWERYPSRPVWFSYAYRYEGGPDAQSPCDGHYDDDAALTSGVGIGEPVYCDGSCKGGATDAD